MGQFNKSGRAREAGFKMPKITKPMSGKGSFKPTLNGGISSANSLNDFKMHDFKPIGVLSEHKFDLGGNDSFD